jgi:hypothetical protein
VPLIAEGQEPLDAHHLQQQYRQQYMACGWGNTQHDNDDDDDDCY